MTLKVERRNTIVLEYDNGNHIKSVESVSGVCLEAGGNVVRSLPFIKFSRMLSRRGEEIPEAQWIPLDETLASYRVDIRGTSRVIKGDLLREYLP